MRFDPRKGHLHCAHCGNDAAIEDDEAPEAGGSGAPGPWERPADVALTAGIREQDFRTAISSQTATAPLETTQVHDCPSCGAQVEFDPNVHAAACPFCAAPIVGQPAPNRHIRPQAVVPFALDEDMARDAMGAWLGRLWFAPTGLAQLARKGRRMDGIYIPYWTFDAQTESRYTGQRGDYYYVQRRTSKGDTETVRKIRWRARSGRVRRFFDDVLVAASRTLPPATLEALTPWDLTGLAPYAPDYLAGLRAEAYTIDLGDAFQDARAAMDKVILRDVRFAIGGDRQRVHHIDTDLREVTFKHVLLPVWVAVYRYQGQVYQVLINGQTGRVQGARPYAVWKIVLAVVLGLAAAAGLAYGMMLAEEAGALTMG